MHFKFRLDDSNPAQMSFWRAEERVSGYFGGVGSGKTFAGWAKVMLQPARTRGMVIAPTYPMMRDSAYATFQELTPARAILSHNKSEWKTVLANGTEILWRSGEYPDRLRGPNLHWAWVDEGAYCKEEAWRVLMGRLRLGAGNAWVTTTTNGIDNWLYEWFVERGLSDYSYVTGSTRDNRHLPDHYVASLEEQYADDPEYAAQELEGAFVDLSGSKRLPSGLVKACFQERSPLVAHVPGSVVVRSSYGERAVGVPSAMLRLYAQPTPTGRYVIGADPAEGVKGGDDSGGVVVDADSGETVAVLAGELDPSEAFPGALAVLARHYNNAGVLCERNNHGHAVLGVLRSLGVVCIQGGDRRPGWNTSVASKAQLYDNAHNVLIHARGGSPILPDKRLKDQLGSIDRATLSHPEKRKRTKVDDEATAWVLAQQARAQGSYSRARSAEATRGFFGKNGRRT